MEKLQRIIIWFVILFSILAVSACAHIEKGVKATKSFIDIYKDGRERVAKKDALCVAIDSNLEKCNHPLCPDTRLLTQTLCDGIDEYLNYIQKKKDEIFEME